MCLRRAKVAPLDAVRGSCGGTGSRRVKHLAIHFLSLTRRLGGRLPSPPIEIRSQWSSGDNVLSPRFPRPEAVAGIAGAVAGNRALDACGTVMKGWGLR